MQHASASSSSGSLHSSENHDLDKQKQLQKQKVSANMDPRNDLSDRETSAVFRKPLNHIQNRMQAYPLLNNTKVTMFRINEVIYLHWTQAADLISHNHSEFLSLFTALKDVDREEYVKKLKYGENGKELFAYIERNLHKKDNVLQLFVYDKLEKFIDLIFTPAIAALKKSKLIQYTSHKQYAWDLVVITHLFCRLILLFSLL